ncbi:ankyrin repeat-containing domain protein [Mycena olivaceomarginata]|nr:ankyrin repeat-containing domain protein [Mycena olivaceomarginata]
MPSESANNYYISQEVQEAPVEGAARRVVVESEPAEREKIIEWASPLNFFPLQTDIFNTRQPGTGEWFLQHKMFKKWKIGEIRALLCRGIRAGKTVLASIVIDDLRKTLANETGVAALYLDHKATAEAHSPRNLLAAIWRQLALEQPISSDFQGLYKKHRAQGTRLSLDETYSMLQSTVSKFPVVFIVVDALDEYPERHRNTLLCNLWKLGVPVRVMLTSRPHIHINHILNLEILDIQATEEDIRKYLEGQIQESSRLSRHIEKSPTLRGLIEEKIVKRSDGMFLLAKLHIDALMTKLNAAAVEDALANLSSRLDGAYAGIVNRINQQSEDDRQLAWRALSWVFNAKTPLRPSELQVALAVEPEATSLNPDCRTDMDIIASVCAGLIVVNEADDKVRLIHYSTQTYFQSVQTTIFPHAHRDITLTCMTYMRLSFDEKFLRKLQPPTFFFPGNPFFHGYPFLPYAVNYYSGEHGSALGVAVWNGHEALVELLIQHGAAVNASGGEYRSPLHAAVWRGHEGVVKELLQHGADLNTKAGEYYSPLQLAFAQGWTPIISLLVKHGLGIDDTTATELNKVLLKRRRATASQAKGWELSTMLQAASWIGHEGLVRLLLKHGANVNVAGTHGSALGEASRQGHEHIVKLLLQHGADVNAGGTEPGSALRLASGRGQIAVVKLLLEHGADVNRGWMSGSALQEASSQGHKAVVKLLLEHCTDVNRGWMFGSALQKASSQGHEVIVKLLLEHGADVNAESQKDGSALQAASSQGHEGIVKLLLGRGADVNAEAGKDGSALQLASVRGDVGVVKILLKHGANVNAGGGVSGGALQAAVRWGHKGLVHLLLKHGASTDAEGGKYGSALVAAVAGKHEWALKLLIEHGAAVDGNGGHYNALRAALRQGNEAIVKVLHTYGADFNARDEDALQAAAWNGHETIVQLLLEHGVDVNAYDLRYGSALQAASGQGHQGIVRLLLDHGADVSAQGGGHGSALQLASEHRHEGVIRLLLEHGADVYAGVGMHDSALSVALHKKHWAIFQLLLEYSAKDNARIIKLLLEDSTDSGDPVHDDDGKEEEEEMNSSTDGVAVTPFPITHINEKRRLSVSDSDWDSDGGPPNRKRCQRSPELGLFAVPVTGTAVVLTGKRRARTVAQRSVE